MTPLWHERESDLSPLRFEEMAEIRGGRSDQAEGCDKEPLSCRGAWEATLEVQRKINK